MCFLQEHSSYLSDSNNQEKDVNREKSSVQEEVRAQHAIVKIGIERDPIVALKPSELKERPSSNICQNILLSITVLHTIFNSYRTPCPEHEISIGHNVLALKKQ